MKHSFDIPVNQYIKGKIDRRINNLVNHKKWNTNAVPDWIEIRRIITLEKLSPRRYGSVEDYIRYLCGIYELEIPEGVID